jgi:GNAT superfamily N-acetyltransferase
MVRIREATPGDIKQIQFVRHSVKENMISNPDLVPDSDVYDYIMRRGKGWVGELNDRIIGFAIVSLLDHNVWALFVEPGFDKKGVGRILHQRMLEWYFNQSDEPIWLSTAPATRAYGFYRSAGWKETGLYGKREIRFEMDKAGWQATR